MGSLSALNVGAGDIRVTFNQHDSVERDKALRMLTDMVSRGYAILVCLEDGSYVRAKEIDTTLGAYIVQLPEVETVPPLKRGRPKKTRIPIDRAHAVGVARSAGG